MKFTVQMKDPDTLIDAIDEAVKAELSAMNLPADEQELLLDSRREKVNEVCSEWFRYGEYLCVEIDTDAKTCTVQPVDR